MIVLSDHSLGTLQLGFSVGALIYLFFILMLLPILPIEETIFDTFTSSEVILFGSGVFGLIFVGSLCIFTLFVLYKQK